ncbi:DUF397 domain-containing protein [Saccharopolyspora spinosa]|nr:DUF397 domain-containing protein [Saccharopolyspora spinosa]
MARGAEFVGVRDSKDRGGAVLVFGPSQWSAFVSAIMGSAWSR